jgi:hypothetical protein
MVRQTDVAAIVLYKKKGEHDMTTINQVIGTVTKTWNQNVTALALELDIPAPQLVIQAERSEAFYAIADYTFEFNHQQDCIRLESNNAVYVFGTWLVAIQHVSNKIQEQLTLALMAHEMRHIYQMVHNNQARLDEANNPYYRDITKYREKPSEIDSDNFASTKVSGAVYELFLLMQQTPDSNTPRAVKRLLKTISKGDGIMSRLASIIGGGSIAHIHTTGDKHYDTFNCMIAKEHCDGNCHECAYGDRIELKPFTVSRSVSSKTQIVFYHYGKLYSWVTSNGTVITKGRNGHKPSGREEYNMALGIQRHEAIRASKQSDIHSLYTPEQLREAERLAI